MNSNCQRTVVYNQAANYWLLCKTAFRSRSEVSLRAWGLKLVEDWIIQPEHLQTYLYTLFIFYLNNKISPKIIEWFLRKH